MNRASRPAEIRLPLLVLTDGGWTHASSRTRAAAYRPLLEAAGFDVTWRPRVGRPAAGGADRLRFAAEKRWRGLAQRRALARVGWAAVLVQRQLLPDAALARLARRGIPLVYDLDDALHVGAPGRAGAPERVAAMARAAAATVVSTPALAPFLAAHRGANAPAPAVIPTPVDTDRLVPAARPPARFTVGWMGSPWTTPYLAGVADVLAAFARERGADVLLVGAEGAPVAGARVVPWAWADEPAHLAAMSVGLMPLPAGDAWAEGKGAYKLYQYMAAGLPVVAAPVGLNAEVVEHGVNGFLAATPEAWRDALDRLADDPALAARMGAEGRRRAEALYSRAVCGAALVDVLRRAIEASGRGEVGGANFAA